MYRSANLHILALLCLIIQTMPLHLKFTNLQCDAIDNNTTIEKCRLKAESRNVQYLIMYCTFHNTTMTRFRAHIRFLKKANGYKPFLYDFEIDCYSMKRRNAVADMVWKWFKDNSNFNGTCPMPNVFQVPRIENTYLEKSLFTLPIPQGDYAFVVDFIFNNISAVKIKVHATVS